MFLYFLARCLAPEQPPVALKNSPSERLWYKHHPFLWIPIAISGNFWENAVGFPPKFQETRRGGREWLQSGWEAPSCRWGAPPGHSLLIFFFFFFFFFFCTLVTGPRRSLSQINELFLIYNTSPAHTRNPKPETRNPEPGIRNPKPENSRFRFRFGVCLARLSECSSWILRAKSRTRP